MSLSERQLLLVREAADILMGALALTRDEALQAIGASLRKELSKRDISIEALDVRPRAERAAFVRGVVQDLEQGLRAQRQWPPNQIATAIQGFMRALHASWQTEGDGE